jgi:hypothetical protein
MAKQIVELLYDVAADEGVSVVCALNQELGWLMDLCREHSLYAPCPYALSNRVWTHWG